MSERALGLVEQAFSQSSLLSVLDVPDRLGLAQCSKVRDLGRGEIVFEEGDPADSLLVLLSGKLKVSTFSANGNELIMTHVHVGDTIGELGVLSGGTRSATVTAVEKSSVALVGGPLVIELVSRRPAVALAMLRQLADKVRQVTDVASDLVFLNLEQRVAKFVLERVAKDPGDELELTQLELASYVGASRQRVNACLQMFHQQGWINLRRGRVTVTDAAALGDFVRN